MRAIRLQRYGVELVDDVASVRPPAPTETIVHIRAAGICHSDAHYRAGRGTTILPLTLGHEVAGVTDDGKRVAIDYLFPNGDMIGKEADGGYAESIVVPTENLIPIPDEVPFEQAAIMMCSTATAHHALRLASIRRGDRVAILGFGGLGFSALQLARLAGAEVFVVERMEEKVALAREFGAIPAAPDALRDIDIALDFAGVESLALAGLRSLRRGGRLMIVAVNLRGMQLDPYDDVLRRERRIAGVCDHTRDELVELMEMTRRGDIDLSRAITRRVPLEAGPINEVLDDLDRGTRHLRTVIVR